MNPEFKRNVWLELTPHRLVAMPLVLAAVFLLAFYTQMEFWINAGAWTYRPLAWTAEIAFVVMVVLWGGRRAAGSVILEIRERTWDDQRLSALGPWSMTWGKLFGGPVFAWYGGGLALATYIYAASMYGDLQSALIQSATLVAVGVLCHATGLLASMVYFQGASDDRRPSTTIFQVIGLIPVGLAAYVHNAQISRTDGRFADWHGLDIGPSEFLLVSTAVFAAWTVLGVYRMMRSELGVRTGPWVWILFLTYMAIYVAGFLGDSQGWSQRLAIYSIVVFAGAYLVAFAEPKNAATFRRALNTARSRPLLGAIDVVPLWLITYVLAVICAVATMVAVSIETPHRASDDAVFVAFGAGILFLTRDLALLLALNLRTTARRGDMAALVVGAMLYLVLPLLVKKAGWTALLPFFWPDFHAGFLSVALPIFVEAVAMIGFLIYRWKTYSSRIAVDDSPSG